MEALLELRDVSRIFESRGTGSVRALDQLNLKVHPGDFTVVRGPSGSGKTTLLLSGGAMLPPTSGTVSMDGRDIYAMDSSSRSGLRAQRIGFVFQQFHLIPYLDVLGNVLAPSLALARDSAEERARELIERFGLTARAGHYPSELSTGERQRTALARALLNSPSLLLADEPTGNLDSGNSLTVLQTLASFAAAGGAVLMVTHDTRAVDRADKVLDLEDGRIVNSKGGLSG